MQKTLSNLTLKSLPIGEYWDAKLPGFGVRVGKRSTTFLFNKGKRRIKIGTYPSLALADARRRAHSLKADPETASVNITLQEALTLFYEAHCTHYRPKVMKETRRYLAKFDIYGIHKLAKLTTHQLNDIIDAQTSAEANKLFGKARTFFRFCVRRRLIDRSPLDGLGIPNKETARARVLTDVELKKIWDACTHESNNLPSHFCTIVKLLLLTGQRRGEIAGLKPSYVDLKQGTICLPSGLTKNGREHLFPLSALAAAELSPALSNVPTTAFIFPARGNAGAQFSGWSKSKSLLDRLSGVKDFTLHDLRRTFATTLARLGTPIHVVEKLLNHVSGSHAGIVGVYQRHQYWDEQVAAVQLYENHLRQILRLT